MHVHMPGLPEPSAPPLAVSLVGGDGAAWFSAWCSAGCVEWCSVHVACGAAAINALSAAASEASLQLCAAETVAGSTLCSVPPYSPLAESALPRAVLAAKRSVSSSGLVALRLYHSCASASFSAPVYGTRHVGPWQCQGCACVGIIIRRAQHTTHARTPVSTHAHQQREPACNAKNVRTSVHSASLHHTSNVTLPESRVRLQSTGHPHTWAREGGGGQTRARH